MDFRENQAILESEDILEVGCGIGNLTEFLLSHGEVIASDVNGGYLQTVENKFRHHPNLKGILLWDIEQKPLPKILILALIPSSVPMSWSI